MMCARKFHLVLRLLALLMLGFLLISPSASAAAPMVERTTPLDGEILERTPTAVGVGFDQKLDQEQSSFTLRTTDNAEVAGITVAYDGSGSSVTIGLPATLPNGVYTIVWHAVSATDGTATDGWSSFSVGNAEDANIVTIPTSSGGSGNASWLAVGARWLTVLGVAMSAALWPVWKGILRPVLGKQRALAKPTALRLQNLAWIALGVAMLGSLLDLLAQSGLEDFPDTIFQTLGHTDWGFWWLVRMAVLILLGIGLALSPWWNRSRRQIANSSLWLLSLVLPVPMVLSGHAIDDEVGRITTVVTSYLFLLALFLLIGGAIWIAIARRVAPTLADAARVRWLVIAAGGTALLTAIYLGWLYIGNRDALTQTTFGRFAIAAIILAGWALILSLIPRTGIGTLAAVGVLLLLPLAGMQVNTTARAQLSEESVQLRQNLSFDDRAGIVLIAPGETGVNHIRLETPGTYLQTETEVWLDLSSPDHPDLGSKSVQMYRVQGNAFEHHGTEFSLDGSWQITVRIEEPGFEASTATFEHTFTAENTNVNLPGTPWKFKDVSGLAGIALAVVGVLGIATAVAVGGPLRKEAGGLAGVAIMLAAVVVMQGRINPVLTVESGEGAINANDLVMVQRGADLYAQYCASCHGADLRGDGPLASTLNPAPADFSQPHTKVHSDEDLLYWIQYGMQGTAMPGFGSQLEDQEIRDIISFIKHWQQNPDEAANATPALGVCEVHPLEFAAIPEIFHDGLHGSTRRGTPMVRAADSEVGPEQTNEVMWMLEQMVNCANQDQFMSQLRLFTSAMLQDIFPQGASWEVTSRATSPSEPVDPANAIVIQDVQSMTYLADGRIAVTVIFSDPTGIGVIPGAEPVYQVTLILVYQDGNWLIDEVR